MNLLVLSLLITLVALPAMCRRKWDKVDTEVSLFYPGGHYVMLTFNDDAMPDEETYTKLLPPLLDILASKAVRATFFVQGHNAVKYPDVLKRMVKDRHEVSNLGWKTTFTEEKDPKKILMTSDGTPMDEQFLHEIRDTATAVEKATGIASSIYRPPYTESKNLARDGMHAQTYYTSKYADMVRAQTNHQVILWSLTSPDYGLKNTDADYNSQVKTIREHVTTKVKKGDIVLMHATPAMVKALSDFIDSLQTDGYETITLSEMLSFPDDKPH